MDAKTTRPIGDWFRVTEYHPYMAPTVTKLQVKESDGNCDGCYFRRRCSKGKVKDIVGACSKTFRDDGKNVIFVKID